MKQASYTTGFVAYWAKRKGKTGLLKVPVAIQIHPLVFEIPCFAAQCAVECLTDDRPGRSPAFAEVLSHRLRMLCSADGPIAIVVDLNVVRSPCQRDRKIGGEAQTNGRSKALWPGANLA